MRIETDRLILREFPPGDWPAILAYQSDPRYLRYYDWTGRTEREVRDFVGIFLDQQAARPRHKFQLVITSKGDDRAIGNCGIRLAAPGARSADIGYELAPARWGHGYATEAARAILAFGFGELGIGRAWDSCVADNIASARVLAKLGMRREAHLREVAHYKGRWWDEQIYAILEGEWRALAAPR